jgi:hypothetical protein
MSQIDTINATCAAAICDHLQPEGSCECFHVSLVQLPLHKCSAKTLALQAVGFASGMMGRFAQNLLLASLPGCNVKES